MVCTICGQNDHERNQCDMCSRCFLTGHKFKDCQNDASTEKSPFQKMKAAEKAGKKAAPSGKSGQSATSSGAGNMPSPTSAKPSSKQAISALGNTPSTGDNGFSQQSTSQSLPHREKDVTEHIQSTAPEHKSKQESSGYKKKEPEEQRIPLPNPNTPDTKYFKPTYQSPDLAGKVPQSAHAPKNESETLETMKSNDAIGNQWLKGRRPNFVPGGVNQLNVLTNHFRLPSIPKTIHRYSLKLPPTPPIRGRNEYRRIFVAIHGRDATERDADKIFPKDARWGTDFEFLWSLDKLNLPGGEKVVQVTILKETGGWSQYFDVTLFYDEGFTLNYRNVYDLSGQPPEIQSGPGPVPTEFARAFNALISRFVVFREDGLDENQSVITQLGANRFFVNRACLHLLCSDCRRERGQTPVPVLYANIGFFMSVRPGNTEPLLNVNTAATIFYAPMSVSDFIIHMDLGKSSAEKHFETLRRVKVKICYKRSKPSLNRPENQTKRITGFGEDPSAQRFESDAASGNTTVESYFKTLNISLRERGLRCVNVGPTNKPQWIPPECLQIVPWQPAPQTLVRQFTEHIIKLACRKPDLNRNLIGGMSLQEMMLDKLTQNPQPVVDSSDFRITASLLQVPARKLIAPSINGINNKVIRPMKNENSWYLPKYLEKGQLKYKKFAVLVIKSRTNVLPSVEQFARELEKVLRAKGLDFALDTSGGGSGRTVMEIEETEISYKVTGCLRNYMNSHAFAVIVLPTKSIPIFQMIKHISDCVVGFPVFICLQKNVGRQERLAQFCDIFSLKICTRMSGTTHSLHNHKVSGIDPIDTMVIGADVTHPSPGSRPGTPSIAAVVANIDKNWMKWPGSLSIQESRKEMITHMEGMAGQRMMAWKNRQSGATLKNLLYYRDGVSESQYDDVLTFEVEAIRKAHQKVFATVNGPPPALKITVVICAKRHHVRFYPGIGDMENTTRSGNLPAGIVVERVVTSPWRFDWYLQSHYAGIGTARSTHYVVLRNDLRLKAEVLQGFTNDLCYVWGRACKPVSLVPPAYYADILCERGRCYLARWSHPDAHAPSPNPPNKTQDETEAAFKARILEFVQRNFWSSGSAEAGTSRGTQISEGSKPHGPWHKNLDNTMFYI